MNNINLSNNAEVTIEEPVFTDPRCVFMGKTYIGSYTYFGRDSLIGSLHKIGRYCSVAPKVVIGLGNHPTDYISTNPIFFKTGNMFGNFPDIGTSRTSNILKTPVVIGNDVWIGANAVIFRGVNIGDGAIIGAGAVVTKNVEPYAIVAGSPARIIKKRFPDEIIEQLLSIKWWNYSLDIFKNIDVSNINETLSKIKPLIANSKPVEYKTKTYR